MPRLLSKFKLCVSRGVQPRGD